MWGRKVMALTSACTLCRAALSCESTAERTSSTDERISPTIFSIASRTCASIEPATSSPLTAINPPPPVACKAARLYPCVLDRQSGYTMSNVYAAVAIGTSDAQIVIEPHAQTHSNDL